MISIINIYECVSVKFIGSWGPGGTLNIGGFNPYECVLTAISLKHLDLYYKFLIYYIYIWKNSR